MNFSTGLKYHLPRLLLDVECSVYTSFAGTKRVLPMITGKEKFSSFESAAKNANQNIIPKLELNRFWSWALDVPQRALQMLHIKDR